MDVCGSGLSPRLQKPESLCHTFAVKCLVRASPNLTYLCRVIAGSYCEILATSYNLRPPLTYFNYFHSSPLHIQQQYCWKLCSHFIGNFSWAMNRNIAYSTRPFENSKMPKACSISGFLLWKCIQDERQQKKSLISCLPYRRIKKERADRKRRMLMAKQE